MNGSNLNMRISVSNLVLSVILIISQYTNAQDGSLFRLNAIGFTDTRGGVDGRII